MALIETIWTEACSNNRWGYNVICTVARPSCTGGAQGTVGLGLQDRPNGWGSEFTRSSGPNLVSCKILCKVSYVVSLQGVATVYVVVLMVVIVMGLEVLTNHIGVDEEDTMGSSIVSFDGIPSGKKLWVHLWKIS